MNRYCSLTTLALAGTLALGAAPADRDGGHASNDAGAGRTASARTAVQPPVLRRYEPADSGMVTLPGPRVAPVSRPPVEPLQPSGPPPSPAASAVLKRTSAVTEDPRPVLPRAPKPVFPTDFERDSAIFCQRRIGQWSRPDASNLLGDPLRERPAYSDNKGENGRIYAFSDPTGHYRALELDFAADTGLLRTVFVYPWSMTWVECRRLWGAQVTSVEANNGRTFYSYVNRRLDVLVEPGGKVVSLGLY